MNKSSCLCVLYVSDYPIDHVHCALPLGHEGNHMVGIPVRGAPGELHVYEWSDDPSVEDGVDGGDND